jgi:hypothetical protein
VSEHLTFKFLWLQNLPEKGRNTASRDADLARYMLRREPKSVLGLTNATIETVTAGGAIRHVEGPGQKFQLVFSPSFEKM